MFHCKIENKDRQNDESMVEGPSRKTAKGAMKIAMLMAVQSGLTYEKVRLTLFEDGDELLRAYGDTPQDAAQDATSLLDRNRRRF